MARNERLARAVMEEFLRFISTDLGESKLEREIAILQSRCNVITDSNARFFAALDSLVIQGYDSRRIDMGRFADELFKEDLEKVQKNNSPVIYQGFVYGRYAYFITRKS